MYPIPVFILQRLAPPNRQDIYAYKEFSQVFHSTFQGFLRLELYLIAILSDYYYENVYIIIFYIKQQVILSFRIQHGQQRISTC